MRWGRPRKNRWNWIAPCFADDGGRTPKPHGGWDGPRGAAPAARRCRWLGQGARRCRRAGGGVTAGATPAVMGMFPVPSSPDCQQDETRQEPCEAESEQRIDGRRATSAKGPSKFGLYFAAGFLVSPSSLANPPPPHLSQFFLENQPSSPNGWATHPPSTSGGFPPQKANTYVHPEVPTGVLVQPPPSPPTESDLALDECKKCLCPEGLAAL